MDAFSVVIQSATVSQDFPRLHPHNKHHSNDFFLFHQNQRKSSPSQRGEHLHLNRHAHQSHQQRYYETAHKAVDVWASRSKSTKLQRVNGQAANTEWCVHVSHYSAELGSSIVGVTTGKCDRLETHIPRIKMKNYTSISSEDVAYCK